MNGPPRPRKCRIRLKYTYFSSHQYKRSVDRGGLLGFGLGFGLFTFCALWLVRLCLPPPGRTLCINFTSCIRFRRGDLSPARNRLRQFHTLHPVRNPLVTRVTALVSHTVHHTPRCSASASRLVRASPFWTPPHPLPERHLSLRDRLVATSMAGASLPLRCLPKRQLPCPHLV